MATAAHGCPQPGERMKGLQISDYAPKNFRLGFLSLPRNKIHSSSFFLHAFISMRDYRGFLNPVSVRALCEIGKPQHLFFFFLMTALSAV